jgi:hypothetical protein
MELMELPKNRKGRTNCFYFLRAPCSPNQKEVKQRARRRNPFMNRNEDNGRDRRAQPNNEVVVLLEQAEEIVRNVLNLPPDTPVKITGLEGGPGVSEERKRQLKFQNNDLTKNRLIEIDEDILLHINYIENSCAPSPWGFDESFFLTQEEVDERNRKAVNAHLRRALRMTPEQRREDEAKWMEQLGLDHESRQF